MAIDQMTDAKSFADWRDITNAIITALGDNTTLSTTATANLVAAINELDGEVGDLSSLTTDDQSTLVLAINEVLAELGDVNSLDASLSATDAVAGINALLAFVGDITTLDTVNKNNVVVAINELETNHNTLSGKVGDVGTLTTTAQDSAVNAINELDGELGDLSTLDTTEQGSVVGSINELVDNRLRYANANYTNLESNRGRFSDDSMDTKTSTGFSTTGSNLTAANSASLLDAGQFIDDNSDAGGGGAAQTSAVTSLLTELDGGLTRLNGFEWHILSANMGSGTSDGTINVSATDYYAVFNNPEIWLGTIGEKATWMGWVRITTASENLVVGNSNVTTYINGVSHDFNTLITDTDGWVHVRQVFTLTSDYNTLFPALYTEDGNNIQVALPGLFMGDVNLGLHKGLI